MTTRNSFSAGVATASTLRTPLLSAYLYAAMLAPAVTPTLLSALVLASVVACSPTTPTPEPLTPTPVSVSSHAPALSWAAVERRVRRGVRQGVRTFRLSRADREDVIAVAMERAWRAYGASEEPIEHPEAWARQLARRACIDELRRQRRDFLRNARPLDADPVGPPAVLERLADPQPGTLATIAEAERRSLVRERVDGWPEPERSLAMLVLNGEADTITAAAHLYREEEERLGDGTMYPQKARILLEARRVELEDLVG